CQRTARRSMDAALHRELQDAGLLDFAAKIGYFDQTGQTAGLQPQAQDHSWRGAQQGQESDPAPTPHLEALGSSTTLPPRFTELSVLATQAQGTVDDVSAALQQIASSMTSGLAVVGCSSQSQTRRPAPCSGLRNKGLKQYGQMVCEAVQQKVCTTYDELADNLVSELSASDSSMGRNEVQNVKRRVYDAINVLLALGIIEKLGKKDVVWRGFPDEQGDTCSDSTAEWSKLCAERLQLYTEVERKQQHLQELLEQQEALHSLAAHTARQQQPPAEIALHLPFIIIQAQPSAQVGVNISPDMANVTFDFYGSTFKIHDDSYVLQQLGLQHSESAAPGHATAAHAAQQPQPCRSHTSQTSCWQPPSGAAESGKPDGCSAGPAARALSTHTAAWQEAIPRAYKQTWRVTTCRDME
ncbi:DP1 transcription factor, partial [Haematococcus lacustris]